MTKILTASLFCGLAIPVVGTAATVTPGAGGTTDWLQNWNNATVSDGSFLLPAASVPDTAIINQDRVVQVTSAVSVTAGSVIINNTNDTDFAATLNINAGSLSTGLITVGGGNDEGYLNVQGGTLNATGGVTVTGNNTLNRVAVSSGTLATGVGRISVAGGRLDVNGGAVTVTGGVSANAGALKTNGGDINLSSGSITVNEDSAGGGTTNVTSTGSDKLNVTGGSFIVQGQTGATDTVAFNGEVTISGSGTVFSIAEGQVITNNDAVFNIDGSGSIITMNNLNLVGGTREAEFNFTLDATGISTVTNDGFMALSAIDLNVDGSAYAGGIASFDLFTSANLSTGLIDEANITVTGLGLEGVDWEIVQDFGNDNDVTLNILTVPEPSTYALFAGLLGLSYVMARRRRS